ncbi:hypothetical protein BDQ12DRAFT_677803 [Crucibulum laeve]|uniref:Gfd2/YDR514C-like C-terminal domain-containing protein n=1 Tax=Crucibulum laeve TaxID=68775 RepID=A0A5C3M9W6_9AGAR|nr:hypothetical protein BDQ12DRAFT_677803 [Crucibulum laeve]
MSDFTLVDPKGWEYDLHSVYSAYIGYFQINNIPWYDRSWGHLFSSFEEFLVFSWPVITVTDSWTGRAHIVTRLTSIGAFLKMIKTRFGETLPPAPNMLKITPFETTTRHLRNISDYSSYKKLHSTLPAAVLSALKSRVRAGETKAIRELWDKKDKTFLAIDFEWSERNEKSCLEWGYAAVRCGHLEALGHWPPVPDSNYRKGHYTVAEYVDKVINKHCPNQPWQYAFGESQITPKAKLPQIIQAVISSFASPDSETTPNSLVLVGHGINGDLSRMEEMKIKLPHNMLIIDTSIYERALYSGGHRGIFPDSKTDRPRQHGTMLSLENLLSSFSALTTPDRLRNVVLPRYAMHNAGNDAFMCLFALQMLLEPDTQVPNVKKGRIGRPGVPGMPPVPMILNGGMPMMSMPMKPSPPGMLASPSSPAVLYSNYANGNGGLSPRPNQTIQRSSSAFDLAGEFGQMHVDMTKSTSGGFLSTPNAGGNRMSRRLSGLPTTNGGWY